MKKLLTVLAALAILLPLTGGIVHTQLVKASKLDKVTICHATGSATNPFVKITVSPNAINGHFENNGTPKSGHEDDILLEGDTDCPGPVTPPPPPPGGGGGGDNGGGSGGGGSGGGSGGVNGGGNSGGNPPGGGGGGQVGGTCTVPVKITTMDVQNATPNDHTLEVVWDENQVPGTTINIRYGTDNGVWTNFVNGTANDGFEAITGLTNGIHYWFQIQAVNACGAGDWSNSVDPLP